MKANQSFYPLFFNFFLSKRWDPMYLSRVKRSSILSYPIFVVVVKASIACVISVLGRCIGKREKK